MEQFQPPSSCLSVYWNSFLESCMESCCLQGMHGESQKNEELEQLKGVKLMEAVAVHWKATQVDYRCCFLLQL